MERSDVAARQLLRQRKKRSRQSCHPCRTRKVKCDKCAPCDRCIKSYPDLCTYDDGPATQVQQSSVPLPAPPEATSLHSTRDLVAHIADERPISASQNLDQEPSVPSPLEIAGRESDNNDNTENGKSPYLGSNAIPTLLRDHASQEGVGQSVEQAFMPMMGIGKTASAYPFSSPIEASQDEIAQQLYQALPADRHVIYLFQRYKEAHAFSPVLTNIDAFEVELCGFIEAPSRGGPESQHIGDRERTYYQKPMTWLSLLFAVLSYGEQFSEGELMQRREKSRLYARLSFQCLRVVNFLVRPTAICVQTLLVLGQVLQNDMNAELAWILLGTTVIMAQSLGLHRVKNVASSEWQLWSALVRQDSLLSSCYDRPPVTMFPWNPTTPAALPTFAEKMNLLCSVMLDSATIGNSNATENMDFADINTSMQKIEDIRGPYLGEAVRSGVSQNIRDRCEQHLLSLQSSFMVAWLCRPALRRPAIQPELRRICLDNLLECVKSFVKLNTLTTYAARSWALVHNGLSSALLLGLLGDDYKEADVRQWQNEILDVFSEDGSQGSINLSAPHIRAIAELKKIKESNTPGTTRMQAPRGGTYVQDVSSITPNYSGTSANILDPNTGPSEPRLDGDQPQQGTQQPDLSPLDLFDYILWGTSDGLLS
ncbi:hypothetical protein M409DRAFT_60489 [Zasmidium cellare ATCC 36951]|uniref:Zn(2)-C6 fungal-type domain-containing protein n=1 Tax=Zasmidium cellare ATCC 36951 TaxID=1080233 RepID=A0A6A6C0V0_ZASCE|nr:uncharacterized protein M409DRAFT_60489 [Zasmidium cellare ATCC 36951]KAF2159898.1 hypothetical protein M409DRAFT_60489 [Zasmidium cellare ATCC 36951]